MSPIKAWTILPSTEASWERMIHSFRKAKRSIDIEQFVFGAEGRITDEVVGVLIDKARTHVRVRLLLDAIGSFSFFQSALRTRMEEEGIEILFHRTIIPSSLKRIIPAFLRDHRKLIIIDEREVHIGGVIIEERARTWRDTNVVFTGAIVAECSTLFCTAWDHATNMTPSGPVISEEEKKEFFLIGNSFRRRDKLLYQMLVKAIAGAKKQVFITTPYFALTRDLSRALIYARSKGVEVCMILPRRSDNIFSDIIGRFFYRTLLQNGIRIFHYTRSILHAKSMSVDGKWATIGSCNLDWLSILLNYELNLVSTNHEFVEELDELFATDRASSEEVREGMGGWWGFWSLS